MFWIDRLLTQTLVVLFTRTLPYLQEDCQTSENSVPPRDVTGMLVEDLFTNLGRSGRHRLKKPVIRLRG